MTNFYMGLSKLHYILSSVLVSVIIVCAGYFLSNYVLDAPGSIPIHDDLAWLITGGLILAAANVFLYKKNAQIVGRKKIIGLAGFNLLVLLWLLLTWLTIFILLVRALPPGFYFT